MFMITPTKFSGAKCMVCGEDDVRVLKQEHHYFGAANSPETIWLCHNCHDKITADQNKMPPKARHRGAPEWDRLNFEDISVGSLLEQIGMRMKKRGMKKYG